LAQSSVVIEDLSVHLSGRHILEDLNLSIDKGQFVAIVGTSGGGKTTLLRTVAGLLDPDRPGSVHLDGRPVDGPDERIAMVFQHFGLFPWKTVEQNVAYGLDVQGRPDEDGRVDRLLDMMHLEHARTQYPHQLSGGMKQRVGIARALAMEPQLLLLDEPFSAVDAITREDLHREVLQLWERQERMNALLVTHDLDEAILMADRIVVLCGPPGRIILDVENPISRPRDIQEIRGHADYLEMRRRLWDALKNRTAERTDVPSGMRAAL
jgi:ABC-type nitrate/sulfonate/bicarbonate transport system ATPase subunit